MRAIDYVFPEFINDVHKISLYLQIGECIQNE